MLDIYTCEHIMDTIGHIFGTTFWDSFEAVLWKICQYAHRYALHMNVLELKLFLLGYFRSAGENMLAEKFSLLLDDLNRFRRSIKRNWRNLGEQLRKHSYIHTVLTYVKYKNMYLFGYQSTRKRFEIELLHSRFVEKVHSVHTYTHTYYKQYCS